jgi:hypothetical protein
MAHPSDLRQTAIRFFSPASWRASNRNPVFSLGS